MQQASFSCTLIFTKTRPPNASTNFHFQGGLKSVELKFAWKMTFPSEECVIIMTKGENSHLLMAAVAGALGRRKDYQSLDPPGAGRLSISCFINSFARVKILMLTSDSSESDSRPYISASFLNLRGSNIRGDKTGIPKPQILKYLYESVGWTLLFSQLNNQESSLHTWVQSCGGIQTQGRHHLCRNSMRIRSPQNCHRPKN